MMGHKLIFFILFLAAAQSSSGFTVIVDDQHITDDARTVKIISKEGQVTIENGEGGLTERQRTVRKALREQREATELPTSVCCTVD